MTSTHGSYAYGGGGGNGAGSGGGMMNAHMSSGVGVGVGPATPLSPGLAPPPNRRLVSLIGSQAGFDYFDPEQLSSGVGGQSRGLDDPLTLADGGGAEASYSYDQSDAESSGAATSGIEFDYTATPLTRLDSEGDASSIISPRQAQALLAAQVMLQSQLQSHHQHAAQQQGASASAQSAGNNNWLGSGEETKDGDDPMAILSMSRGNSNLQAALDELESRTSVAPMTNTLYRGPALSPTLLVPTEAPDASQGSWAEYAENAENGYHSDAYTSATDTEEHDMIDGAAIPMPSATRRQEYDGSKYAPNFINSNQPSQTQAAQQQQQTTSKSQQHVSFQPSPPSSSSPSPPSSRHQQHVTHAALQSHNSHHSYGSHGSGAYTLAHNSHSHHHHHHHHTHSIAPTVPPVAEQADREADAEELPQSDHGSTNESSLLMDQNFLLSLNSASLASLPAHAPTYSRASSASSVSSAGGRSGGSSPQPSQRQLMSQSPTMAQQLAAQHASVLAPTPVPGRRHSSNATLQVAHLLHANSMPAQGGSAPQQKRMIGRSPSADSLKTPVVPPRHSSPQPQSGRFNPTISDGRAPLHLHPSPIQEQLQAAYLHHPSHSPQPYAKTQVKLESNTLPPPQQFTAANSSVSASAPPPASAPSFPRSFSHDGTLTVKAEAYYSDGSDSGYSSAIASSPQYNQFVRSSASADVSRRGSYSANGMPPTQQQQQRSNSLSHLRAKDELSSIDGTYSASAASSGSVTPLCGPGGSVRGSGGNMGDLHRLLMLHAQNGNSVTSLLPICPSGSAGAASSSSAHPAPAGSSDRIGAYTREERAKRLARYNDKRSRRCWTKRVLYQVRKTFALSRKRVGGRFIKKQHPGCPCPDLCVPECPNYVPEEDTASKSGGSHASPSPSPSASSSSAAQSHKKK